MQELFQFPIDLAVINLVERDTGDREGFCQDEKSYALRLRLRPTGERNMTEDDGRDERMVQQSGLNIRAQ